jgi:transposase InsO family protein
MTSDTDIRFIDPSSRGHEPRQYHIAFLDDRPRYVVHAELVTDKCMAKTAQALVNSLDIALHPLIVTLNNGNEFVSKEFIAVLKARGIKHARANKRKFGMKPFI